MSANVIIGKKTRYAFREVLTHKTLREIQMEFDSADIEPSNLGANVSGERRRLVEQYYGSLDFSNWNDIRKLIKVYESVLEWVCEESQSVTPYIREGANKTLENLIKLLEKEGFFLTPEGNLISSADSSHLPKLAELAHGFDSHELQKQIERVKAATEDDPGLAIGTAKEILETTCKTILIARSIRLEENWDVPELVKQTRKVLKLIPDSISSASKGADTIKRLLSNLGSVAQGVSELRNFYGTGHGRTAKRGGLSPRHARLAVGAATTLAVFLFETHSELMNTDRKTN